MKHACSLSSVYIHKHTVCLRRLLLKDKGCYNRKMMIQKVEMCMQLLKLAYEFVMVFIGAVDYVLQQANQSQSTYSSIRYPHIYIGLLP
ncbi:hypothetical protein HanRHA438_Chr12g0559341 [Helianthus annuus]|nr:hypothetical protein HanIR_Chr12g0591191 [Helianthus annuus]KAJ0867106.1 hypothetical protein HanRHA438_Chr12g0559341 [Helianthus annuus]